MNPDLQKALRLLDQDRTQAVELLTETHRDDPTDVQVTHALALMTLWHLVDQRKKRVADWRLCLGLWANLLANPVFWTWFTEDAGRRYRKPVPSTEADAVRERLEHWLYDTVARWADEVTAATFALEVRAARLVAVRGGIQAGTGKIACGPLLVDHLDLHAECLVITQGLARSQDERNRATAAFFTQLGPGLLLLERGSPVAALKLLKDMRCANCRTRLYNDVTEPRLCHHECPEFQRQNIAFSNRKQLRTQADALIVDAHLAAAEQAITAADPNSVQARSHWNGAVKPNAGEKFRAHLDDVVMPRVRFFLQKRKYDTAITLLEDLPIGTLTATFGDICGDASRLLSELLAQRGVEEANKEKPSTSKALADLRMAAKLNPVSWYACRNLVVVLSNAAGLAIPQIGPQDHHFATAADHLLDARRALRSFPRAGKAQEIDELLGQLSESLGAVYNAHAVKTHERGNHDKALTLIDKALRERPGDRVMLQNRAVIQQAKSYGGYPVADIDPRVLEQILGSYLRDNQRPQQRFAVVHDRYEPWWRRAWERTKDFFYQLFTGMPR